MGRIGVSKEKMTHDGYMVVLHEKTLETDIKPFQQGIDVLHEEIECSTIDHATSIDDLEDSNIDMWIDDEGLLKNRLPVFIFADEEGNMTGQIVGNIVFQSSDNWGESLGMTYEKAKSLIAWLDMHQIVEADIGMMYQGEPNNDVYRFYVIRNWETVKVRKRIDDMKQKAKDEGWFVIE